VAEIKPRNGIAGEKISLDGRAAIVHAASIFHFGTYTVGVVKQFLAKKNIPVRL
jgi:imidazole glycerol phosphate synthase subunit HisF